MRNLFACQLKKSHKVIDNKNEEMTTGTEEVLERIYVSLRAYLAGVNPYPIETIINSIVNEITEVHDFRS
jgi:hypothetical protein